MIKIHAGAFKGRNIKRPNVESTKETASMVREAVFNSLYKISGNVLDLFAGSGSYGITAMSFGANNAYFVDNNARAISTISDNLINLNIKPNVYKMDYQTFLKQNNVLFDYVFLDPPYNFDNYEKLLEEVYNHLNENAYIILEVDKRTILNNDKIELNIIKDKKYGSKRIIIYEK